MLSWSTWARKFTPAPKQADWQARVDVPRSLACRRRPWPLTCLVGRQLLLQQLDFLINGRGFRQLSFGTSIPVSSVAHVTFHDVRDPVRPTTLRRGVLLNEPMCRLPISRFQEANHVS